MFELVLPKACMVGHVDLKFVLNPNTINIPQIQVTLLKNKAPGLGKVSGEDALRSEDAHSRRPLGGQLWGRSRCLGGRG